MSVEKNFRTLFADADIDTNDRNNQSKRRRSTSKTSVVMSYMEEFVPWVRVTLISAIYAL